MVYIPASLIPFQQSISFHHASEVYTNYNPFLLLFKEGTPSRIWKWQDLDILLSLYCDRVLFLLWWRFFLFACLRNAIVWWSRHWVPSPAVLVFFFFYTKCFDRALLKVSANTSIHPRFVSQDSPSLLRCLSRSLSLHRRLGRLSPTGPLWWLGVPLHGGCRRDPNGLAAAVRSAVQTHVLFLHRCSSLHLPSRIRLDMSISSFSSSFSMQKWVSEEPLSVVCSPRTCATACGGCALGV